MYQPRSFISTQLLRTNRNIQNAQWKWRTEVKSWRGYLMHGRVMYRYLQRLELMYTEKSPTRTLYAWTNGGYAPVHAVLCVKYIAWQRSDSQASWMGEGTQTNTRAQSQTVHARTPRCMALCRPACNLLTTHPLSVATLSHRSRRNTLF